jgi:prolyl-tRNA synthetase
MKLSNAFWQTYKEVPKEAEIISHILLLKAGLIIKSASGIYQYLPLAVKVLQKIERIVREEMNRAGAQEITMSVVTPASLWQESGRWDTMGAQMLKFKDRSESELCISPTNEETVTDIFRKIVKSYKQLPLNFYQINTKFRDEIRPRFGLMRGREFIMKDAYSFHADKESLDEGYAKMYQAYQRVFERMNLEYIIVEADAGAMGTSESKTHEFQLIADSGEDTIVYEKDGSFASNLEKAKTIRLDNSNKNVSEKKEVLTPNCKTIEEVCDYLKIPQEQSLKGLVYTSIKGEEQKNWLILILGDDQLNELKLANFLGADQLFKTRDNDLDSLGLIKGFIGPVDSLEILVDEAIDIENGYYVVGGNKKDLHISGFNIKRDLQKYTKIDLRLSKEGDLNPENNNPVSFRKGIEVGHIFQLGDKYTKAMNTTVQGIDGKPFAPLMGCYGIGISRIMAAAIEQCHDENGIMWPKAITPFHIHFCLIGKSEEINLQANSIYSKFLENKLEVLFDDRGLGPGSMFKDADLLGVPVKIVIGERDFNQDGLLEISYRHDGQKRRLSIDSIIEEVKNYYKETL